MSGRNLRYHLCARFGGTDPTLTSSSYVWFVQVCCVLRNKLNSNKNKKLYIKLFALFILFSFFYIKFTQSQQLIFHLVPIIFSLLLHLHFLLGNPKQLQNKNKTTVTTTTTTNNRTQLQQPQ